MSNIKFRDIKFRPESLARIRQMQDIVAEYAAQDLRLTARQLYYQFVSRDLIPNKVQSYKNLTSLLTDARYAGLIDWNAIEDRGREPDVPAEWESIQDLVDAAVGGYRLPRWDTQETYAELWVEKQALAGVLEPMAREFHVTLMVNKGYSSASAMYESAMRFRNRGTWRKKILFYLGDHDPSGEDMVRDIEDRLNEFEVRDLTVTKLALTMRQVEVFNPPSNPVKINASMSGEGHDVRSPAYIAKHGAECWEVDALPPDELQRIIRRAFEAVVDREEMDKIVEREERGKAALRRAAGRIRDDSK